jgi:hypothetical protein
VPYSEGDFSRYQNMYDNIESSDLDFYEQYNDDAVFYDRLDEEIYRFVREVQRQLQSVSREREILVKSVISDL